MATEVSKGGIDRSDQVGAGVDKGPIEVERNKAERSSAKGAGGGARSYCQCKREGPGLERPRPFRWLTPQWIRMLPEPVSTFTVGPPPFTLPVMW